MTETDNDLTPQRFEDNRPHLRAIAIRMLGSSNEADDAVQETWLRFNRADIGGVENLNGWLTTVVARICLDMLRARSRRREVTAETVTDQDVAPSPEDDVLLADSVGRALLVVLDTLSPSERLAFVLHDLFQVPFDEIAPIVGRTPVATRQLASRARHRVQSDPTGLSTSAAIEREVVAAFLAAAHEGDFARLLLLLDPDVVLRADAVAIDMASARASAGAPALSAEVRGTDAVAQLFAGGAKAARLSLVDGQPGAAVSVRGNPVVMFGFTVRAGHVIGIDLVADPLTLQAIELAPLAL